MEQRTGNISITNGCNVPDVVWNIQPDLNRSGAEWYVGRSNKTLVLISDYINPVVIQVAGQLRIDVPQSKKSGYTKSAMIQNEKDLELWGITSDDDLEDAISVKKKYEYLDNPWFEVVEVNGRTVLYACHDIFNAVQYAIENAMRK